MLERKWILPITTGLLAIALVGCVREEPTTKQMPDMTEPSMIEPSITDPNIMMEGSLARGDSIVKSPEEMMDNAHYYAARDGELPHTDRNRQSNRTEKHCEGTECPTDDVNRAMRDMGRGIENKLNV